MAGVGPPPNLNAKRRNKRRAPERHLTLVKGEAPNLPTLYYDVEEEVVDEDGVVTTQTVRKRYRWHARTQTWWAVWTASPLTSEFSATDWEELLITARFHSDFWKTGEKKYATEYRLRVAAYGATPADRARLNMHVAVTDALDAITEQTHAQQPQGQSSRELYGG